MMNATSEVLPPRGSHIHWIDRNGMKWGTFATAYDILDTAAEIAARPGCRVVNITHRDYYTDAVVLWGDRGRLTI